MPGLPATGLDSRQAWLRLLVTVVLMTIGGGGMYAAIVVLPAVQTEFGIARADASLPYTLTMIGFGFGGILMGRLADRFGVIVPALIGTACIGTGFWLAGGAQSLWGFAIAQSLLMGAFGSAATFSPLVADSSLWFERRRGIAVAICASGNYLSGTIWPPVLQHFIETVGWRQTYFGAGLFCVATMLPLAMLLRGRPPGLQVTSTNGAPPAGRAAPVQPLPAAAGHAMPLGLSPITLQTLLVIAGVACCVAMAMPQVHIVAYCADLGYGPARGAEMLALMLGCGIVSRVVSGIISDRIGGLRTLLLGSILQGVALVMFLPSDALVSLYVVSALFGLFQGGIVPSYAIIVRDFFPAGQAGTRVALVLTATMLGMALGGWMSGALFDLTGSYQWAFINGIGWNLLNVAIAVFLLRRSGGLPLPGARLQRA
jgi:MFS family permease